MPATASYEHASGSLGPAFQVAQVGRGAAHADYDRDGDLDVLITNNHGPARLLRNDGGNRHKWISVEGGGDEVEPERARRHRACAERVGGRQWSTVRSGSSYASQSDLALTFGLGSDAVVQAIEIEWPSGIKDRIANVPANQFVIIEEGKGLRPPGLKSRLHRNAHRPPPHGLPPTAPAYRPAASSRSPGSRRTA